MDSIQLIVLLLFLAVVTNIAVLVAVLKQTDVQRRTNRQHTALMGLISARQSKTKFDHATQQAPGVDARAKTTRRDTNDIPVRGATRRPIRFHNVGGPDGDRSED